MIGEKDEFFSFEVFIEDIHTPNSSSRFQEKM
jgi:hypothetical protein